MSKQSSRKYKHYSKLSASKQKNINTDITKIGKRRRKVKKMKPNSKQSQSSGSSNTEMNKKKRNRDTNFDVYVLPFEFISKCGKDIVVTINTLYHDFKPLLDTHFLINISMSGQRRLKRVEEELISESEILGVIHINKNMDEDNVTRRWFKINKKGNSSFMLKKSDNLSTIKTKFRNSAAILLVADNFKIGNFVEKVAEQIIQSKKNNIDNMQKLGERLSNLENQMSDLIRLVKNGTIHGHDNGYCSDPSPRSSLSPIKHKNNNNKSISKCDIDLSTSQTPSLSPLQPKNNNNKKISKTKSPKQSDEKNDEFEVKDICDENQTSDGSMRVEVWVPGDGHCAALCNSIGVNEFDFFMQLNLNYHKLEDIAFRTALNVQGGFATNLLTIEGDNELRRLLTEDKRGLTRLFDGLINEGDWNHDLFDSLILLFQAAVRYNVKFYSNNHKLMEGQSNQVPHIPGAPTIHVKLSRDHFAVYCIKALLIEKRICTMCGQRVSGNIIICGTCDLIYDEHCIMDDVQRGDKAIMKKNNFELSCRQCSTFNSIFSLGPKKKKSKLKK